MKAEDLQAVLKWSEDLGGVFALTDLKVLFRATTDAALYKKLESFLADGLLVKIKRGLYARPDAPLAAVSSRICPESYVSTGTVLARNAMIGSVPARRIQAVKVGRPRRFVCDLGTIEHLSITPRLFFGFADNDGIRCATPEKAYLDACYFLYHGRRFSFDLDTDVDTGNLDGKILEEYLRAYDQRFCAFFRKVWAG